MSEEKLITKELAILAKEKGFDKETLFYYDEDQEPKYVAGSTRNYNKFGRFYSVVTLSFLQKWLRVNHHIHLWPVYNPKSGFYSYEWYMSEYCHGICVGPYTYEKALEEGLMLLLSKLESKEETTVN